jgi:hypothetical protein
LLLTTIIFILKCEHTVSMQLNTERELSLVVSSDEISIVSLFVSASDELTMDKGAYAYLAMIRLLFKRETEAIANEAVEWFRGSKWMQCYDGTTQDTVTTILPHEQCGGSDDHGFQFKGARSGRWSVYSTYESLCRGGQTGK